MGGQVYSEAQGSSRERGITNEELPESALHPFWNYAKYENE